MLSDADIEKKRKSFLQQLLPVKKQLYNFILKSLNFHSESEDLYQETILKAFRYYDSLNPNKKFKPWIFTIACNLIKDYLRKEKPLPLFENSKIAYRNNLRNYAEIKEIYRVASRLKTKQRKVFYLYYYNDFKISEISDITGLSRVNIKFILNQCRKMIKSRLEVLE